MNVAVLGLWHLGSVTAACVAESGHAVIAFDPDAPTVADLQAGKPPVAEPGLEELVQKNLAAGRLRFTHDVSQAVSAASVVWVCFDTPVDDDDRADVDQVIDHVVASFPFLQDGAVVLASSQLPVGSVRRLEAAWIPVANGRRVSFACSPENLRLGKAIVGFTRPDRVVIGVRDNGPRDRLEALFAPIAAPVEWMSVESAEMTKHAINAFLATSVAFINELATLCEESGADAKQVERGLKTEKRIGPYAYLSPGSAVAGGTLARDVMFLRSIGSATERPTPMLDGVVASNVSHRSWARRRLGVDLKHLKGSTIAVWGLTYKPGTDTLRRSEAVELCRWLVAEGARVRAHDPAVRSTEAALPGVERVEDPVAAVRGAAALVVATEWPDYRGISADVVAAAASSRLLVLDANRFLAQTLGGDPRFRYVSVGQPRMTGALTGRAALITGASQGLGLEIARAYVDAGANVLLCARDAAQLTAAVGDLTARAAPGQIVAGEPADVSRVEDVDRLMARALALFPQLHVLVNNAGIYGPMAPIEDVDWPAWVRAMEINLYGSVLPCRAVLPHFKQHRYGKIVQLSGGGATNPLPRISAYAASKAAVVRFAESVALEVREFGIDVNAVAPGALDTRMLDEVIAAGPGRVGQAFYDRMVKTKQGGGTPLETGAALAVFLGSAASDGITGRLLSAVWDPWAELPARRAELDATDVYTLRRIVPKDRGFSWEDS